MARRAEESLEDIVGRLGVREVAYRCQVSPQAVHGWLAGSEPRIAPFLRLLELAGIPVDPRAKRLAGIKD